MTNNVIYPPNPREFSAQGQPPASHTLGNTSSHATSLRTALTNHPFINWVAALCVVLMIINTIYSADITFVDHKPKKDQRAEEYYDPTIVLKNAKIPAATSPKNFQLRDFDACGNYRSQLRQAGYDLSNLSTLIPQPQHQVESLNQRVPGNPSNVIDRTVDACFWILGDLINLNIDYITLQEDHTSKPPHSSERRVLLNMINGPENPAQPGHDSVYSAARYEIKGYTAFIVSEYDSNARKRLCNLTFWPYLSIGATGSDCDKVKKFALLILP